MKRKKTAIKGVVAASAGRKPTPEQLAVINGKYALTPLEPEQVYVRRMYLANNAVDRDGERFSDETLAGFAATLPGKGLLDSHPQRREESATESAIGRFFFAEIVDESPAEAKARAGEDILLPEGIASVKWLVGWFYIPLIDEHKKWVVDAIESGLLSFVSIGFDASYPSRVRDPEDPDKTLYWEYQSGGEAREGSIVWLGAQPGAAITKQAKDEDEKSSNHNKEEKPKMKKLLKMLGLSEDASEESAIEKVENLKAGRKDTDAVMKSLGVETEDQAKALKAEAEAGRAYHASLVKQQVDLEARLGRHETDDAKSTRAKALASRSVVELGEEIAFLQRCLDGKHPATAQTSGGSASTQAGGKALAERVEELKAQGKSHYEAVKQAAKETPGCFTEHVSAQMKANTLN